MVASALFRISIPTHRTDWDPVRETPCAAMGRGLGSVGHAHPYTPGSQMFAAAVEVHVLPLWVTFAPSG